MVLLHYATLVPQGPAGLAAVRFTAPIRVAKIRIFANGDRPFLLCPDVIAETLPDAFFLDMYFNAQSTTKTIVAKDKQRAPNALVQTVVAYAGGQVDFKVDMGTEYATRLMIVKGKFERLSMAIYGNLIPEDLPVHSYEPRSLPTMEPYPLSEAIDPARSSDPTGLAKQLLSLIPHCPPLPLVIRLMFCLKPTEDDWEHPDFPYLYADLETDEGVYDLEGVVQSMSRPARDDLPHDIHFAFATRVAKFVGPKSTDQSYQVAKILSITASQHPGLARALLDQVDLASILDSQTLDHSVISRLLDATANAYIARYFGENEDLLALLQNVQHNMRVDKQTQISIRRLISRVLGWESFLHAISNAQGDFVESVRLLKDIGTEEHSLGIWLESMIIHDDIVAALERQSVVSERQSPPPCLFNDTVIPSSREEFLSFLRAFLGVATVLSVWAWADSVGSDVCRERSLAILTVWQGVDGYREQLTRRLEWITMDNDPPRKSGILAERVLSNLVREPQAILHDDFGKTLLKLEPPLSYITEQDRMLLRKLAFVAEDGLPAVIEDLTFISDRPLSPRRLQTMRVSLAILRRDLLVDDNGEWRINQAWWDEKSHGVVCRLIELLTDVSEDLNVHFTIDVSQQMNQQLYDQLFRTAGDLMILLIPLSVGSPLTRRELRSLATAVADLFACSEIADNTFSQTSPASIAAQETRQICLDLLRSLSGRTTQTEQSTLGAKVVLQTLLQHATHNSGRDPVLHVTQIFALIDHLLPDISNMDNVAAQSHWVTAVFPAMLSDLDAFFRLLDTENKVHLLGRLVKLDDGVTGIGEWQLMQELKHLLSIFYALADAKLSAERRRVYHYQIYSSVSFLLGVITSTSASLWYNSSISENRELSRLLSDTLEYLREGNYASLVLSQFTRVLAQNADTFSMNIRFSLLLLSLQNARMDPVSPSTLDFVLDLAKKVSMECIVAQPLRDQVGQMIRAYAHHAASLRAETAAELLMLLEWMLGLNDARLRVLSGITSETFVRFCDSLRAALPSLNTDDAITRVLAEIAFEEDEYLPSEGVELPESLTLSVRDVENLIHPDRLVTPSTPQKTKTPDIFGVVISPPTALLRSPAATGLTKTYLNNDFRQLRQVPQARLNTSRLPSMHVDDFENASPLVESIPDVFTGGSSHP